MAMLHLIFHVLMVANVKITAFWHMAPCSLINCTTLMMEAVCTSEMSVYFYDTTWHHVPKGCHLNVAFVHLHVLSVATEFSEICYWNIYWKLRSEFNFGSYHFCLQLLNCVVRMHG
jgi:hypothetical protein